MTEGKISADVSYMKKNKYCGIATTAYSIYIPGKLRKYSKLLIHTAALILSK